MIDVIAEPRDRADRAGVVLVTESARQRRKYVWIVFCLERVQQHRDGVTLEALSLSEDVGA